MVIAFQGEPGAYSEAALYEHFGEGTQTKPHETFESVFISVTQGECSFGFIPIENSLAGSIHQNYDLLLRYPLSVVGEHFLPIHHCLISCPGVELSAIKQVMSHPQALAQCEQYLRSLGVKSEPVYDTAGSVKMLRQGGSLTTAAIASHQAAKLYGMSILAENIEDDPNANLTRFLIIARQPVQPEGDAKTSIVFSLKNTPGSLFRALSVFALRDIDLTKIESRPLAGTPWEYLFYIDFAGSAQEKVASRALDHLAEYAILLRVLGSYPRHFFHHPQR
jgi:prephenate dehydratase